MTTNESKPASPNETDEVNGSLILALSSLKRDLSDQQHYNDAELVKAAIEALSTRPARADEAPTTDILGLKHEPKIRATDLDDARQRGWREGFAEGKAARADEAADSVAATAEEIKALEWGAEQADLRFIQARNLESEARHDRRAELLRALAARLREGK
jgi:flagellar biosynthesis/type III secretory pathway protein FliH